jgi:hypothetical protein
VIIRFVTQSLRVSEHQVVTRVIAEIDHDAWEIVSEFNAPSSTTLSQPALVPTYRYHVFISDRDGDAVDRRHVVVELALRDLKEGSGLRHCPLGDCGATTGWAVPVVIAYNVVRWVGSLGLKLKGPHLVTTICRKFISLSGRITHSARRRQLHLPTP